MHGSELPTMYHIVAYFDHFKYNYKPNKAIYLSN